MRSREGSAAALDPLSGLIFCNNCLLLHTKGLSNPVSTINLLNVYLQVDKPNKEIKGLRG